MRDKNIYFGSRNNFQQQEKEKERENTKGKKIDIEFVKQNNSRNGKKNLKNNENKLGSDDSVD
jgi:hypothetical protein